MRPTDILLLTLPAPAVPLCSIHLKNMLIMKILVNNKETELTAGNTIADLARQLELPAQGVAVAVHNRMVPRTQWEEQILQPGDSLVIIKAACGG